MALINYLKKKKKKTTISTAEVGPTTKPGVTFVDVGREAPAGTQFVDSSGTPQGTFVRTGGYTIVGGRQAGGGGGSPSNIVSTSGEVTKAQAYKMEGGQTITTQVSPPQTVSNAAVLAKAAQQQQRKESAKNYNVKEFKEPVYTGPYVTRKEPTVKGYTASGKPVYEKGEAVVKEPFAEQYGQREERVATPEEQRELEASEYQQGFTGVPPMEYNVEDYYSYGGLLKLNRPEAVVRKASYDVGKVIGTITPYPIKKGVSNILSIPSYVVGKAINANYTSPKITKSSSNAQFRGIVGEAVLFAAFAPMFTTTAQTAVKLNVPAKITTTGTYQRVTGRENVIETQSVFRAEKAGTVVKGVAKGRAETEIIKVGDKEIIKIFGQSRGLTAQTAYKIPGGVKGINQQVFATQETGLGWIKGKIFSSFTKGSIAISPVKGTGTSFSYYSLSAQAVGKKGIAITAGGTLSEVGKASYSGVMFPVARRPFNFIPLAAKKGQVLITPVLPKTVITTLPIAAKASYAITESSIRAFSLSIPGTAVVSQAATGFSLIKIPTTISMPTSKSMLTVSPMSSSVVTPSFKVQQITKMTPSSIEESQGKSVQRSVPITSQKFVQTQVLVPVQRQQLIQKQVLFKPKAIPISNLNIIKPNITIPQLPRSFKQPKQKGFFSVFLRRFGLFKPIGTNLGLEQAFTLGKERTRITLGATFEVRGAKARNIYGYKTKPTKKGIYYIELPKYRLSTPTEKKEIKYFKLMKGGKKR